MTRRLINEKHRVDPATRRWSRLPQLTNERISACQHDPHFYSPSIFNF
jgi:hypothetical protein